MTIPYLPGPEATVGPAVASLIQSVGQIADPNFEFRRTFERALASNPGLLQQLADLEFTSGGELSKNLGSLFSPQALAAVTGARPSVRAQTEKGVGEVLPQLQGLTAEELPQDPTLLQQAGVRALTGTTPGALQQETLEGRLRRVAGNYLATLSPERLSQIGAYASIPAIMQDEHFIKSLELQERLYKLRQQDRISEWYERLQEQSAIWWQHNTGIGTSADWALYFSPEGRKRLERIKTGGAGVTLTADDERLQAVDEYYRTQAPAERKTLDLNRVGTGITQSMQAVLKADNDALRSGMISVLNQQLANFAQLSQLPLIEAKWTEKGEVGQMFPALFGKTLVLINTATKEQISPDDLAGMVSTAQVPQTQGGAGAAALSPERARARALELQGQGKTPDQIFMIMKQEGYNITQ